MTAEDLELTVRLARWMGWTECATSEEAGAAVLKHEKAFRTYNETAPAVVIALGRDHCGENGKPWRPMERPDHAAEVMAEAGRRGLRVEATVCGASGYATAFASRPRYNEPASVDVSRHLFVDVRGGHHEEHGNFAAGWCRAVCLAVLAAAEGGA